MNHKRGRCKNVRAGCLLCKAHKQNNAGGLKLKVQKAGFGNIRRESGARDHLSPHELLL